MISKLPAEWLHGSRALAHAAVLLSLTMPVALAGLESSSISQGDGGAVGRALDNELRAGSAVEGDVRALRLAIEDNAVFRGKVDLTQGATKKPDGAIPSTNGGAS